MKAEKITRTAPASAGSRLECRCRRRFLCLLGAIYFVAFVSFAVQYDGLLGTGGLMPAKAFIKNQGRELNPNNILTRRELWLRLPTLAWFVGDGVLPKDVDALHLVLATVGATVALGASLGLWHHGLAFLTMWVLYLSLYAVGQTFFSFQWDILLLEAGLAHVREESA